MRDLIRPNIITVIVKAILGFIVGALTGIIPRIMNVLSKLELFIRKVLTPGVFNI
ncbi:hypothetical protein C0J52_13374 [Blattella germanica]|nr:hypothetical protein C0J52_13374 [Blattella germanica]